MSSTSAGTTWRWKPPLRPSLERELGYSALELVPDWYRDMTPSGTNAYRPWQDPKTEATVLPHLSPAEYRVARFAWELRASLAAPQATDRELWARRVRLLAELRNTAQDPRGLQLRDSGKRSAGPATKPVPCAVVGPFEAANGYQSRSLFRYLATGGSDGGAALKGTLLVTESLPPAVVARELEPVTLLAPGKVRVSPEPSDPKLLERWVRAKQELERRHWELFALSAWYRVCPQAWAFNPELPTARDRELVPVNIRGTRSLVQDKAPFEPKSWLDYGIKVLSYLRELAASGQALGQDASKVGRELEPWIVRGLEDFSAAQAVRTADHFLVRECGRLDRWAHVWNQRVVAAKTGELAGLRRVPRKSNLVCDRRRCYKHATHYVNNRALCTGHARELAGKGVRS